MAGSKAPTSTRPHGRPAGSGSRDGSARRTVVIGIITAGLAVAGMVYLGVRDEGPSAATTSSPVVGGDLHAAAVVDGRRFVSGHEGAGYSDQNGSWQPIPTLEDKDAMGWASGAGQILVGGHGGLYASTDDGATFAAVDTNLPVSDVHALGAAGDTVYLASPQGGLFVSADGGQTFDHRSDVGGSFMGSMVVDPDDPDHVLAPDMTNGVVETTDGGVSWRSLGGPAGTMSVSWDPRDQSRIFAIGMDAAALSDDGGQTWQVVNVPAMTMAGTVDEQGRLIAAALAGDRAELYLSPDDGDTWTRI